MSLKNVVGVLVCFLIISSTQTKTRLYGSRDAVDGQFPYVVLHILRTSRSFNTCSGSLVTSSWVLTAAHCVNQYAAYPRNHLVVAGKANLNNYLFWRYRTNVQFDVNEAQFDLQERRAARVFYHPSYSRFGNNDVAVIQVHRPFFLNQKVNIIALSREPMATRRMCSIQGFGMVENNRRKHILQYIADMPAMPAEMCRRQRLRDVICLADITRGICHGDSGGPIVCDGSQRGVASHAITSGPTSCGVGNVEQYYTDTNFNFAWIESVITGRRSKKHGKKAEV